MRKPLLKLKFSIKIELTAPKTGVFVNELIAKPQKRSYDPRKLQQTIDFTGEKYYIIDKRNQLYAIPLSKGLTSKAAEKFIAYGNFR